MKYEKAQNLLPKDIVELLQQYADGKYIYIPRKAENKKKKYLGCLKMGHHLHHKYELLIFYCLDSLILI